MIFGKNESHFVVKINLTPQQQIEIWRWAQTSLTGYWSWVGSREIETICNPQDFEMITFTFECLKDFVLFSLTYK